MNIHNDIWIRNFRSGDAEQVRELFSQEIGRTRRCTPNDRDGHLTNNKFSPIANSSRAYALRASWSRPNSLLCYVLFALGLATAASPTSKAWLRVLGAGTAFLSAAFFSFHRWELSKAFLRHSVSANTADFADIGTHYGVVTRPDGTSFFPGNNGFWVAELLVRGRPTGEIVGCIGLGEL